MFLDLEEGVDSMLFYMELKNEREIEMIPSSYFVFMLSDNKHIFLSHNNYKLLKLMPDITYYRDIDSKKKAYRVKLKKLYIEYIIMIASLLYKKSHNESVVIVSTVEENKLYGFNIAEQFAKTISKRYNYKNFEFTNTVLRHMRIESRFEDNMVGKLLMDMDSIGK